MIKGVEVNSFCYTNDIFFRVHCHGKQKKVVQRPSFLRVVHLKKKKKKKKKGYFRKLSMHLRFFLFHCRQAVVF